MRSRKCRRGTWFFSALVWVFLCACVSQKSQTHDDGNYATATTQTPPPAPSSETGENINAKSSNPSVPSSTPPVSP